jgi:hypothetical protein
MHGGLFPSQSKRISFVLGRSMLTQIVIIKNKFCGLHRKVQEGTVKLYKERPEIVLEDPKQIVVVEK